MSIGIAYFPAKSAVLRIINRFRLQLTAPPKDLRESLQVACHWYLTLKYSEESKADKIRFQEAERLNIHPHLAFVVLLGIRRFMRLPKEILCNSKTLVPLGHNKHSN